MFKRKKSYKGHINNPKPKENKHETTFEGSFRASLLKEFEEEFYNQEKILEQREHEFGM